MTILDRAFKKYVMADLSKETMKQRENRLERYRQYYKAHREYLREQHRLWKQANKERAASMFKRWSDKNMKHRLRYNREWNRRARLQLLAILGYACVRCGFTDVRALHLDHIKGGGNAERKIRFAGNVSMYRYYLKHPDLIKGHLQVLCANHNDIKKYEEAEGMNIDDIVRVKAMNNLANFYKRMNN